MSFWYSYLLYEYRNFPENSHCPFKLQDSPCYGKIRAVSQNVRIAARGQTLDQLREESCSLRWFAGPNKQNSEYNGRCQLWDKLALFRDIPGVKSVNIIRVDLCYMRRVAIYLLLERKEECSNLKAGQICFCRPLAVNCKDIGF